jgi:hypothetical protein
MFNDAYKCKTSISGQASMIESKYVQYTYYGIYYTLYTAQIFICGGGGGGAYDDLHEPHKYKTQCMYCCLLNHISVSVRPQKVKKRKLFKKSNCDISGSHGGKYEDDRHLGYSAV